MREIDGIEDVLRVLAPHKREIEDDFNRHNEKFLALAAADHDAIGRVLKVHLIVESFLNHFLASHFGLDNFEQARLSFHQKVVLLPASASSAAFVRPGILQLNSVRNKFGHRLDHRVAESELSAVYEVLQVVREGVVFGTPLKAIEAFGPVACAFLSIPPKHLQDLFLEAFAKIRIHASLSVAVPHQAVPHPHRVRVRHRRIAPLFDLKLGEHDFELAERFQIRCAKIYQ